MTRIIAPKKSGNDNIQTPEYLCKKIIDYFSPSGKIIEPACGMGNFLKFLPNAKWCEISKGKDFFDESGLFDWVITNPPFSKIRKFLIHSYEINAKNILFLMPVNHLIALRARMRDLKKYNYQIKEILLLETPKEFIVTGFQYCVYHLVPLKSEKETLLKLSELIY